MPHAALAQVLLPAAAGPAPVDAILDAARTHLGMEIAFASRFEDGQRQFTHVRSDIALPLGPGDGEPLEQSFCKRVLDGRLPALIHDAAEHDAARALPITAALPIGSHLNVPLRLSDGSLYGSFCCISRIPDRSLTGRDLDTLRAFAQLAAGEIERELSATNRRAEASGRIEDAIAHALPSIHLQSIHRLADSAPIGVEALARFPDHGSRPPSDWFNEAAALGLGVALELAAAKAALAALPYVPAPHYMAINVSPETVLSDALAPLLAAAPPGRLVLELTEHAEVENYFDLSMRLAALKAHARIAIDDVGAGYAGMRHILDLGPDILKLDMSLTRDVDRDPARRALIGAMVAFAESIGASLVAEGVQRSAERAALAALGVGAGQGWHFSRAMPPVAAQQLLMGVETVALSVTSPAIAPRRPALRVG